MTGRLLGKMAIVTGAGQGIGASIARCFIREGARVVIAELDEQAGKRSEAELRALGGDVLYLPVDVAKQDVVNRMVERALAEFGTPDILVNNAGINVFTDPLECTEEDWRRCFSVDLDGVWYCTRAVLPHMLKAGKGDVINIASVHASQIIPGCFPYPIAKHGVLGLTRALAIEYAARNIRVNAISPGYIATRNVINYWDTFPDPQAEAQRAMKIHPVGRIGEPDEIGWTAVFLASDECRFMTGANLVVDGGRSILHHDAAS